jgi:hypothetical protein
VERTLRNEPSLPDGPLELAVELDGEGEERLRELACRDTAVPGKARAYLVAPNLRYSPRRHARHFGARDG